MRACIGSAAVVIDRCTVSCVHRLLLQTSYGHVMAAGLLNGLLAIGKSNNASIEACKAKPICACAELCEVSTDQTYPGSAAYSVHQCICHMAGSMVQQIRQQQEQQWCAGSVH